MLHSRSILRASRHVVSTISPHRSVFVMSRDKGRNYRPKQPSSDEEQNDKLRRWADQDDKRKSHEQDLEYQRKLLLLKTLTSSVSSYVKHTLSGTPNASINFKEPKVPESFPGQEEIETKEDKQKEDKKKEESLGSETEKVKSKNFNPENSSINTPLMNLPSIIKDRLGPATRYLVHRDTQYWKLVMVHLQTNGGFEGLKTRDVVKVVQAIPSTQILSVFPMVQSLMNDANINETTDITNAYLLKLVVAPTIDVERLAVIESTVNDLRKRSKGGKLSTNTYENLVIAYGKTNNIAKLEKIISEMKSLDLNLSVKVYSSILTTSVYKTKDHRQAVQLFDQMKFLAGYMAPGSREYRDIIVSYINNDDIEKALDLYQEMCNEKIQIDQQTLVALARGCITRPQLKLKAWDFIFEIYEKGMKPTVGTLEYMLYLAARDSDLSLARALYQQLIKLNSFGPRSLGFLLLAYSTASIDSKEFHVPAITNHEAGRRFRLNILDRVSFEPDMQDSNKAVPFLPKSVLSTEQEVLSESSAVMAHALLFNQTAINSQNVNTFLNVAARFGSLDEFKDRFEQFTTLNTVGVPKTKVQKDEKEQQKHETGEVITTEAPEKEYNSQEVALQTKSPVLSGTGVSKLMTPRCTYTYTIALKAAGRHKNYAFAEQIWQERGIFRKTVAFRNLTRKEKDAADFVFATSMVHCLTEMNLLDDALALLVSTEYQFKWTWRELSPLHLKAVELGHEKVTRTIRGIANRAQIKFEGKIRRKDFKIYVMQNKR